MFQTGISSLSVGNSVTPVAGSWVAVRNRVHSYPRLPIASTVGRKSAFARASSAAAALTSATAAARSGRPWRPRSVTFSTDVESLGQLLVEPGRC